MIRLILRGYSDVFDPFSKKLFCTVNVPHCAIFLIGIVFWVEVLKNRLLEAYLVKERFLELERSRVKSYGARRWVWRLFSLIGNAFFKKSPPDISTSDGKRFLNLGAGSVLLEGFVNADFYRLHLFFSRQPSDWWLDIARPMNCKDDYWDGVLIEHTNEHILYSENYELLSELFRTMKPGAKLRIVVPDLDKYLVWETARMEEAKMNRYASLAEAMSNLTQNHLHLSVWNFDLLSELLCSVGFVDIEKSEFGSSSTKEFKDSEKHRWQSLYVEACKPKS